MKIWIAVISHRHGINTYAARTRAKLRKQLYAYVREWWASEIPDEPMPQFDKQDAIDQYFERVGHETLDGCSRAELVE